VVFRLLVTTAAALPNEDEHRFVSSAFVFYCDDLCSIYVPLHEHFYAQQSKGSHVPWSSAGKSAASPPESAM
jgi:hypothetical protein